MFYIFIILLSYNGNKVDGNLELRSKQQLKHCLKHSKLVHQGGELMNNRKDSVQWIGIHFLSSIKLTDWQVIKH